MMHLDISLWKIRGNFEKFQAPLNIAEFEFERSLILESKFCTVCWDFQQTNLWMIPLNGVHLENCPNQEGNIVELSVLAQPGIQIWKIWNK